MATETPESEETATKETHRRRTIHIGRNRLAIAAGGLAIFAAGTLLGIGVTRHASGIPSAAAATNSPNQPSAADQSMQTDSAPTQWDPLQEIHNLQLNMDRMFDEMTTRFGQQPSQSALADDPNYSLSLRLKDVNDHYEVRARLPDAKASDVNVSLLDKQTLKVEVSDKNHESAGTTGANIDSDVTEWNHYEEVIELPGPVKSEHMKVDGAKHELLVTLPKA